MSFDAVARKREHYQEAGEHDCPTCTTPQKCWRSTADIHSVLICQRCQTSWLDPIESEKARQAMWEREERLRCPDCRKALLSEEELHKHISVHPNRCGSTKDF